MHAKKNIKFYNIGSPSHASAKKSVMLGVVGEEGADSLVAFPYLEACRVAQTRNGKLSRLDKIHACQLSELAPPGLTGLIQNIDVQLEVGF